LNETRHFLADTSGRAFLGTCDLGPLEHWDRWFESSSIHKYIYPRFSVLCCPV